MTARCATNRPAFLVLTGDPVTETETEILHMYCAMSLPEAHELQQTVLARVSNLVLAAALVKAACNLLHCRYAQESVCCENAELQAEWDALIIDMGISLSPAVQELALAPREVIANALSGSTEQGTKGMLEYAAGEELTERVLQIARAAYPY